MYLKDRYRRLVTLAEALAVHAWWEGEGALPWPGGPWLEGVVFDFFFCLRRLHCCQEVIGISICDINVSKPSKLTSATASARFLGSYVILTLAARYIWPTWIRAFREETKRGKEKSDHEGRDQRP